jgi:hypothetical protein
MENRGGFFQSKSEIRDCEPGIRIMAVHIVIGTVEVVRLALRGASGRSATRPTSVPKFVVIRHSLVGRDC